MKEEGREDPKKKSFLRVRKAETSCHHTNTPHPVTLLASGRVRHYHWTGPGGAKSTVPGERTLTSAQGPEQTNPSRRQPSK